MSLVEFLLSNWGFSVYTTYSYPKKLTPLEMFPVSIPRIFKNARRAFLAKSLFSRVHFYSSVENSITCIGILQEVPLLLPQSTGCNANKTPSNKIHFLKYAFKTSENLKGKISKNLCFCKNRH